MKCLVCDKNMLRDEDDMTFECESSSPYHHYYYQEFAESNIGFTPSDYIRVDIGDYFITLHNSKILEIWIDISGKGDRRLCSIPCNFEIFSKLCKLETEIFNQKMKLYHTFS